MTTKTLKALLIAALLASSGAYAADNVIEVSMVEGKQQALFKVADAKCILVDDLIQCTPVLAGN